MAKWGKNRFEKSVQAIHRTLDLITVVLLLTGQITIGGVFITTEGGFSLSLRGAITGSARSIGIETVPQANLVLDAADAIAALLLILDQINVIGTFITNGSFTIVVSGPAFGEEKRVAYSPDARKFFSEFKDHVFEKCRVQKHFPRR
ncbi:hypothetical protein [Effusibacillus dendaii]|uniref:Uncharacterized protein n=1 Tax=Effusibacillus dendaii TaxID=2743772 RepID=A0A7I8D8J8_9BACL|nr:hypothetical protein [Effusibacillus dendaii]BCJ86327.1 hypothetical protein skT53_13120 [Effusibacillus dendaii]